MLAFFILLAVLARGGSTAAQRLWRGIVQQRVAIGFLCIMILVAVAISTFLVRNLACYGYESQNARQQSKY